MDPETEGEAQASAEDTTLDPQVEGESPETEGEQPGEDTAAPETDDGERERAKMSAKERVQQAVARQREAERDRDFYREQALRQQAPEQPAPVAQPKGDPKPDPASYADGAYDAQYVEDLTAWKANQIIDARLSEREAAAQIRTALDTFDAKVRAEYPDGEPAGISALRRAPVVPRSVLDLVVASEIGPKMADHLGNHPADLQRISALPAHLQGAEFVRLEQRLSAKPAAKIATDAPQPPTQVRGAGGQFGPSSDTRDFAAFEKLAGAKG